MLLFKNNVLNNFLLFSPHRYAENTLYKIIVFLSWNIKNSFFFLFIK